MWRAESILCVCSQAPRIASFCFVEGDITATAELCRHGVGNRSQP
jgi:hypothetical protein